MIFDFISDLNLTIELALKVIANPDLVLLICAIGCGTFFLLPLIANLTITTRIKSYVPDNKTAIAYFEQNSALFVSLCIISGSAYPALQLVSSRLFNLEILDCGLTKYELRRMIHVKVICSVILENIPQIIFQTVYIGYSVGMPSNVVLLSLTASVLSVIAALIAWLIEGKASNCVAVQYHIEVSKERKLTVDETDKIKKKKERKNLLKGSLCSVLSIPRSMLEIGFATVNTHGINYHIVHYAFPSEYASEDLDNGLTYDDAMRYVQKLYTDADTRCPLSDVFLQHFDIQGFKAKFVPHGAVQLTSLLGGSSTDHSDDEEEP